VLFLTEGQASCGGGRRDEAKEDKVRNAIHRAGRVGAAGAATLLVGCGLSSVGGPPGGPAAGPAVTITQHVAPSALLAVLTRGASAPALLGLVTSTARPNEDVRILKTGAAATTIVASDSPAPSQIVIQGPPVAPGSGQTNYLTAQYTKRLKAWQVKRATEVQAEAAQTRYKVSAWLSGLGLGQKVRRLVDPPGDGSTLAAESAVAASALAGVEEGAGNIFGQHRVIVLFGDNLSGELPAGELTGVDVIVVTSYLPTEAAASAAQSELLGAGAAQAAVVGPEVTATQLDGLVSADLSQGVMSDSVSAPVLFGNDSYALGPAAISVLEELLPKLREPGVIAVISGFTSTPGTAEANYTLSFQRATAVARFLEANEIPESSLIIVGHGATDVVGAGNSGANRRVLVVIEKPSGGG
jgi:outer membrane protein OmpA-like peptidoglycan-associated protein